MRTPKSTLNRLRNALKHAPKLSRTPGTRPGPAEKERAHGLDSLADLGLAVQELPANAVALLGLAADALEDGLPTARDSVVDAAGRACPFFFASLPPLLAPDPLKWPALTWQTFSFRKSNFSHRTEAKEPTKNDDATPFPGDEVPALGQLLQDAEVHVRRAAAESIGEIGAMENIEL